MELKTAVSRMVHVCLDAPLQVALRGLRGLVRNLSPIIRALCYRDRKYQRIQAIHKAFQLLLYVVHTSCPYVFPIARMKIKK